MTTRTFTRKYAIASIIGLVALFGVSFGIANAETNKGVGVFIGANGNAYVHGATVTATSTTGITAVTVLGGNTINWNVLASTTTRFGKLGSGFAALANVAIGDIVSFFGKSSGTGSTITVEAKALKDHKFKKATSTKDHDKNGKHRNFRSWFRFHGDHDFKFGKHGKDN